MVGKLGDILIDLGHISQEQLAAALKTKPRGQMLGDRLLALGLVDTEQLGSALSEQFDVPYVDLDPQRVHDQIVRLMPESFLRQRRAVPVDVVEDELTLAMVAPDDIEAISEAELITGYRINAVISLSQLVEETLDKAFDERILARQTAIDVKLDELREGKDTATTHDNELDDDDASPVVRLVSAILSGGINAHCSDIHLEPQKPEMRVRYRVDGELQQVMTIPDHIEDSVVARIKVMADMNTTEKRRPQDGQLAIEDHGRRVNFRVSSIPTVGGEKMVLRILDEAGKEFSLDSIGFSPHDLKRVQTALDKPHGMFVVTGPTGSGKSTTLYAALTELNQIRRNIVTVEDPVEFQIPGINQVQSDNEFGMGFANALKFIMRQDPDVIMLGEIRDHETATMAVQAALTGHLLLSTLHTNDAIGSVARLRDLGVDAFKISGALLGTIAQRLLRSICPHCKEPSRPNAGLVRQLASHCEFSAEAEFYKGRGCSKCAGSGYAGRLPIFEIMIVTTELATAIDSGVPASKLREIAIRDGMVELVGAGVNQALAGNTTLEEVYFKTLG